MVVIFNILGWIALVLGGIFLWPVYLIVWFLSYDYVDVVLTPIHALGALTLALLLLVVQMVWFAFLGATSNW